MNTRRPLLFTLAFLLTVPALAIDWLYTTVAEEVVYLNRIAPVDIDADGDDDLVTFSQMGFCWWERDGLGYTMALIDSATGDANDMKVADIDGDGDIDLLTADEDIESILCWDYDNGSWNQTVIVDDFLNVQNLAPADLDNDGDMDIIASSDPEDIIKLFEQDGGQWHEYTVTDTIASPRGLHACDMNQDGLLDVVCLTAHSLIWYEQTTLDQWTQHTIRESFVFGQAFQVGDLDNDGDLDILAAADGGLREVTVFYQMDEGWRELVITHYFEPRGLSLGDIDLDGDLDFVLTAGYGESALYWFENTGAQWVQTYVESGFSNQKVAYITQYNYDGYPDIVLAQGGLGGRFGWFEQQDPPYMPDVEIHLTRNGQPFIPASGGMVTFDATFDNHLANAVSGQAWLMATLPNGNNIGPLVMRTITAQSGVTTYPGLTQFVPGYAPFGVYMFHGLIGVYSQSIVIDTDYFTILKESN